MALPDEAAAEIAAHAEQTALRVHYHLHDSADDCVVEIAHHPDREKPFAVTRTWYNTDCVGPSHGGTTRRELTQPELVEWLIEVVEEPFLVLEDS